MLEKLYKNRFDSINIEEKKNLWKILCSEFFQKYIAEDSVVVDFGAGYCEFLNNIRAARKIAVDLNKDAKKYANSDVVVLTEEALKTSLENSSADIVFISNFLEHMNSKEKIFEVLSEAFRILKPGGRIIVLQPNITYVGNKYWDFFDHKIPLTEKSLSEALKLAGFNIKTCIKRFLPYTTKSGLPKWPFFIRLYLKNPLFWNLWGKQCLIIAEKSKQHE